MASSSLPLLPRRCHRFPSLLLLSLRRLSTASSPPQEPHSKPPPTSSLSARLSFVFDQLDSLDRERQAKDQALQHLRSWHQSHATISTPDPAPTEEEEEKKNRGVVEGSIADVFKREVELVHPWPEWIELMERLGGQKYFEFGRRTTDEDQVAKNVGIDLSGIRDEIGYDFSRDWITVRNACMNFGRDRFDILRSLARKDLQILVGHGCPSMDPKAVFSAKLLRKYVHLDEGDVCSSCSLRNTCGRGYILTHKEDEARTLDVMRVLLTYGFDHIQGTVENKPLLKMKSVKTVVRKLLHEIVKLSAVPIDPNLSPPVIKKPPPKVKQPPPPPKRRVGRDDIEMKKGDWLCPKCDFMNFAKNTVCLQCDAKRPKRQLLPGEWECPKCDFLNYRRNMVCFHCEHKRPQDEFTENDMQAKQSGPRTRLERASRMSDVTNAWNFDFDDNESDGADVAAFEFADPPRLDRDATLNGMPHGGIAGAFDDDDGELNKMSRPHERGRYSEPVGRVDAAHSSRLGFDDFDDEEDDVDNYELDVSGNNSAREVSRRNFSEFEGDSDLEESGEFDRYANTENRVKNSSSGSEDVGHYSEFEDDLRNHPHWKSSHVADSRPRYRSGGGNHLRRGMTFGSDDDLDSDSDDDVNGGFRSKPRKSLRDNSVRKPTRRGRNADFDDDHLGSEFDDDENPRMRRAGRLDKKGPGRSREFRSDDRMHSRRNSLHSGKDKLSSRGSRRFDRGSGGDRFDKWADNDQIKGFNRGRGRGNRSANLSSDFGDDRRRFDRGSGGDQFDKRADNDRIKGFNRGRGRGNRFANPSSDFGDDRPRRRIIER